MWAKIIALSSLKCKIMYDDTNKKRISLCEIMTLSSSKTCNPSINIKSSKYNPTKCLGKTAPHQELVN